MVESDTSQDNYLVEDTAAAGKCCDNSLAIAYALTQIGAQFSQEQLRDGQKKGINAFTSKRDAMVILPTGHGKSLIYWTAPFINDYDVHSRDCGCNSLQHIENNSIVIIVSPLIALMKDQVAALRRAGVEALYMGESSPDEEKKLKDGQYSLVFCSPESILADRGTALLSTAVYRKNVCSICVDEG